MRGRGREMHNKIKSARPSCRTWNLVSRSFWQAGTYSCRQKEWKKGKKRSDKISFKEWKKMTSGNAFSWLKILCSMFCWVFFFSTFFLTWEWKLTSNTLQVRSEFLSRAWQYLADKGRRFYVGLHGPVKKWKKKRWKNKTKQSKNQSNNPHP